MAVTTPKKFAIQQVFEILLRKPADESIVAYLTDTKTSGLENTMEMVYPTGARGNVYIGGGFGHSKRAKLNVSVATWNTEVMALQNGTIIDTGANKVNYYDTIVVGADGKVATKFKAEGIEGGELGFIYKLAADGTIAETYTQGADAEEGMFVYDADTKEVTFADTEKPAEGDYFACSYAFIPAASQKMSISGTKIPETVLVDAYGLAKDICTGDLFPCVISGQAQVDGNWNFDVSADGEPAEQSLALEFVKGCLTDELYTFTIFTEE